jgi:hypothetical protein
MANPAKERERGQSTLVAHHEAGHAVMAINHGVKIKRASISKHQDSLGRVDHGRIFRNGDLEWNESPQTTARAERAILICLAGPYSQKRFAPRSRWRSQNYIGFNGAGDFDHVLDLTFRLHGNGEVAEKYLRYMEARAEGLVACHWKEIEAVAQDLLKYETMTGDEIKDAMLSSRGIAVDIAAV